MTIQYENIQTEAQLESLIHLLRDELGSIAAGAEPAEDRHPLTIWEELCEARHQLAALHVDPHDGIMVYTRGEWSSHSAGWLLHVEWAVEDQSYVEWYSTRQAAVAALLKLADEYERLPDEAGTRVDLTAPGCQSSQAWVSKTGARYYA